MPNPCLAWVDALQVSFRKALSSNQLTTGLNLSKDFLPLHHLVKSCMWKEVGENLLSNLYIHSLLKQFPSSIMRQDVADSMFRLSSKESDHSIEKTIDIMEKSSSICTKNNHILTYFMCILSSAHEWALNR
jgi:hypothetical protein